MNIVLRELYLADNRLNSLQDSAQLGNVLKFNGCIQILDLRNNHIMDSGECCLHVCPYDCGTFHSSILFKESVFHGLVMRKYTITGTDRAEKIPAAIAADQKNSALPSFYLRGVSKMFVEWYQKTKPKIKTNYVFIGLKNNCHLPQSSWAMMRAVSLLVPNSSAINHWVSR